jgi:cytochrome c biogenesis protein CcmG/thiol:disulfide interchange protein DsbE
MATALPPATPPAPTASSTAPPLRWGLRLVGVAAMLALLVTILLGGGPPLDAGAAPPPLAGTTLDGGRLDIADFRGDLVFINVWATWCAPCLMELPELAAAAQRHKDVHFVGLLADGGEGAADVVARFGIPYPNVLITDEGERAWNVDSLPASFLLGKDGRVLWSVRGAINGHVVDDVLAAARAGVAVDR